MLMSPIQRLRARPEWKFLAILPRANPVESTTGAVAVGVGGSCSRQLSLMPVPHSSPWLRFQSPLIELDGRISRIRLSDEIMPSPTESSPFAEQGG